RSVATKQSRAASTVPVALDCFDSLAMTGEPLPPPLQTEVAERRMIVGATAERPVIFAFALLDPQIVDAGNAHAHQPLRVKLPVLVAVAAEPVAAVVAPFIGEAHRNPVIAKRPYFLDQPVIELAVPFSRQECRDLRAAHQEFRAIAPATVLGIGKNDARGIA